jgi:WD40 repeat protein
LKFENNGLLNGMGELSDDRRSIVLFTGGGKLDTNLETEVVDLATGKITKQERKETNRIKAGHVGLVPGGKYLYALDPNVDIFDRKTLTRISTKMLAGTDILSHSFSEDGGRYALVTGGRIFISEQFRQYDPETQSIVRVHNTVTGKTLFAFPASTRWVHVKLSPDGNRLAVVNDDGTIEVWKLPPVSG